MCCTCECLLTQFDFAACVALVPGIFLADTSGSSHILPLPCISKDAITCPSFHYADTKYEIIVTMMFEPL